MDRKYVIRKAEVVDVYDEYEGLRIKVRLNGTADGTKGNDQELDNCYPLLPKLLHVNPKRGETVLLLTDKLGAEASQRYFIGPILSQPYFYNNDQYKVTANSLMLDNCNNLKPQPAPSRNSDNWGTLPDRDDIAILGRKNSDMILKDNEVRIRCGMKAQPDSGAPANLVFNKVDPAFIQLKYFTSTKKDPNDDSEFNSVANIVADRINLISPRDGNPTFTSIPDRTDLVSDKVLCDDKNGQTILCDAHPLVHGDSLVAFLHQMIEIFRTHTHPFSMLPPCFNQNDTDTLNQDLNQLISKTVRCN